MSGQIGAWSLNAQAAGCIQIQGCSRLASEPKRNLQAYSFLLGSELTTGIVLKIDEGHALV